MKIEKLSFLQRFIIVSAFILITYGIINYIEQLGK